MSHEKAKKTQQEEPTPSQAEKLKAWKRLQCKKRQVLGLAHVDDPANAYPPWERLHPRFEKPDFLSWADWHAVFLGIESGSVP